MKNINNLLQLYHNILLNENKESKNLLDDLDLKCFLQFLYSHIECECAVIYKFDEEFKGEIICEYSEVDYSIMGKVASINVEDTESNILRRYRIDDDYLMATSGETFSDECHCAILRDIDSDILSDCYKDYLKKIDCKSYIITGVYKQGRLWGLLGIYNSEPRDWEEREVSIITIYSFILSSLLTYKQKELLLNQKLVLAEESIVGVKIDLINKELKLYQCEERLEVLNNARRDVPNLDIVTGLNTKADLSLGIDYIKSLIKSKPLYTYYAFLINCERFRVLKDHLGIDNGNLILKEISRRLINLKIPNVIKSICYKYSDTQFVLLTSFDKVYSYKDICTHLQDILNQPHIIKEHNIYCPSVIGATEIVLAKSNEEIVRELELAIYEAESRKSDRCYFFENKLEKTLENLVLEDSEIRNVLHKNTLIPYYQVVKNINTGKVEFLECLLRYRDGANNLKTPYSLITYAEKTGLIFDLENLFIPKALKTFSWIKRKYNVKHPNLSLSLNTSPGKLLSKNIVSYYLTMIKEADLEPKDIIIEITESSEVPIKVLQEVITEFKRHGFRVAVDDFGTGYCSLTYILNIPFDIVKLDKSFTDAMSQSHNKYILEATIHACKISNKKVVAEGVETYEQLKQLKDIGVELIQGYLYHKPCSAFDLDLTNI